MLLRRITQHVKAQNWFAVVLDLMIVVLGVFIGLQVQDWASEKKRLSSERQYFERLHDEVQQLQETRSIYDDTRQFAAETLQEISATINGAAYSSLTGDQCRIIAHSSFTTIPPAELPSATELISSGRLDQIASADLKNSILSYVQDAARVRDLIISISNNNVELSRVYPELIQTQLINGDYMNDAVDLNASCDLEALRNNPAFLNDFNSNAYNYVIYNRRGVAQVSQKLAELHAELDQVLSIKHTVEANE